jgi:hypothetical protein
MNEIKELVREVALDIACQVKGEKIDSNLVGVSFEIPMCIDGHDVAVRFVCFLSNLEFELVGVFGSNKTELTEYENEQSVRRQVTRLNSLFNIGLRRAGFRDRELLRRSLEGN